MPIHPPSASRLARGFTLIEILIVIGLIAALSSIVVVAVNPLRQFAQARNAQRASHVSAILNAVGARIADTRGAFTIDGECTTPIPSVETEIGSDAFDIRRCLVPNYITELPVDPANGSNTCTDAGCTTGAYQTRYTIRQDAATQRITVCAPGAEEPALPGTGPICVSR